LPFASFTLSVALPLEGLATAAAAGSAQHDAMTDASSATQRLRLGRRRERGDGFKGAMCMCCPPDSKRAISC
jgi:hypothetical protein